MTTPTSTDGGEPRNERLLQEPSKEEPRHNEGEALPVQRTAIASLIHENVEGAMESGAIDASLLLQELGVPKDDVFSRFAKPLPENVHRIFLSIIHDALTTPKERPHTVIRNPKQDDAKAATEALR